MCRPREGRDGMMFYTQSSVSSNPSLNSSANFLLLLRMQGGGDLVEDRADAPARGRDRRDRDQGDQRHQQRVLQQVLTRFVLELRTAMLDNRSHLTTSSLVTDLLVSLAAGDAHVCADDPRQAHHDPNEPYPSHLCHLTRALFQRKLKNEGRRTVSAVLVGCYE